MDPPSRQGYDPYANNFDPNDDNLESEEMSFPDFCGNLGGVMGSAEGDETSNYASTDIAGNTSSTQNYGVPLYGLPLNQQQSRTTPPPQGGMQRERTYTDESTDTTGTVDKKTLVKLMREQVDLVRRLTNAQIAQKAELERVKEEKRVMEEAQQRQQQQAKQAAKLAQKDEMKEVMKQAQQQQLSASQTNAMAPINEEPTQSAVRVAGQSATKVMYPAGTEKYTMPLHPARLRVDTSDSDSKSVASSIFKRPPDNRYIPLNVPKSQQKVRRHPDAMYFRGGYDENTTANGDPSMASTIKFPTAIVIDNDKRNRTGAFEQQRSKTQLTGPGAIEGYSKDRIEITHIPERNVVGKQDGSCSDTCWWAFSRFCTILIPNFALFWVGRDVMVKKGMSKHAKEEAINLRKEAKQAWRDKIAIFIIMMMCCGGFIAISGVIPMFVCRETRIFTMDEIQARTNGVAGPTDDWTVIYGTIYDVENYQNIHPGGSAGVKDYIGQDASKMFPRRPPAELPLRCLNLDKNVPEGLACSNFDEVDQLVNLVCHTDVVGFSGVNKYLGQYERGLLAHKPSDLKMDANMHWVSIYDRVYNVTGYLNLIQDETTGKYDFDSDNAYLHDDLNTMIKNTMGEDATSVYEALYDDDVALSCLDDLFYVGIVEGQPTIYCHILSLVMYVIMIAITGVLAIQCLCSVIYIVRCYLMLFVLYSDLINIISYTITCTLSLSLSSSNLFP